jgi:shikimate kinase
MKVFLLGYMASGKSTIGDILAKKMNFDFIDLDAFIELKEHRSISEIFKCDGEITFRKLERYYLEKLNNINADVVISLGGGTPCYYDSIDFINKNNDNKSFYLKTKLETIVRRLKTEKESRPLVNNLEGDALFEFVARHVFERSYYYNKAQYVIDNVSIEDTLTKIVKILS